jgi:hypothetical protein
MSRLRDPLPRFPLIPLLVALAMPACDKGGEEAKEEKKAEEEAGPAVKVQLPPSPDFDEGKAPVTHEDGSFSVYGLRKDIDQNVADGDAGKEVMVKGWIQEIYVAPECPEGEVCPPPKQPHVWITDAQGQEGKKRAMMVVNYRFVIPEFELPMWKGQPEVVLEKGKQYTFKGKFKRFSDTGFAFDSGLLEFVAYKPHDPETGAELNEWVFPPGSSWHSVAVQKQEADNAALAEKAKETAVKGGAPE